MRRRSTAPVLHPLRRDVDQATAVLPLGRQQAGFHDLLAQLFHDLLRGDALAHYERTGAIAAVLAFAVARRWRSVLSNALEPGWVPTKMGGPGAPDDLSLAPVTQVWLAVSDDPAATVTGQYFYHQQRHRVHPAALRTDLQDELLSYCAGLTAAPFPRELRKDDCETYGSVRAMFSDKIISRMGGPQPRSRAVLAMSDDRPASVADVVVEELRKKEINGPIRQQRS